MAMPCSWELNSFVDSVQHHERPAVSAEEGKEALRIASVITDMIKTELKQYGIADIQ